MASVTLQKTPSSKNKESESYFNWFKTLWKLCNAVYTVINSVTGYGRYGINATCMIGKGEEHIKNLQPAHKHSQNIGD